MSSRPYALILAAGLAGAASTGTQIVERIAIADNPGEDLFCDLSATLQCGSILTAWQSSVFGDVPNAMIGLSVFVLMLSAGLSGVLGSTLSKRYLGVLAFFAVFMLGFTLWYFWQSAFVLNAICVFCIVNGLAVVLINAALLRLIQREGMLERNRLTRFVGSFADSGDDKWLWLGLVLAVAAGSWIAVS
jgi:uncharacterized membrane protein